MVVILVATYMAKITKVAESAKARAALRDVNRLVCYFLLPVRHILTCNAALAIFWFEDFFD